MNVENSSPYESGQNQDTTEKGGLLFARRSDLLPFNHSVERVSMNNADDKSKVGRDWFAFVVAWIPYSLLTYRFWHNIDDAFISLVACAVYCW